jgi:UDP-galactopyranose mutase
MIDEYFISANIEAFVSWYYTPMMLGWSAHLRPLATIYDCMDELSAFKNAPAELRERERDLFDRADVVFTGGHSLYEAKKGQHANVYAFPSSIDVSHFSKALGIVDETPDQEAIPFPRIGFVGVIDERLDIGLLGEVADLRPDFHFIMIGPVVKIDERDLPRRANIHYLGGKDYSELPSYLSGWQAAMMPFAINESTKFISPTKTPEYLAAGLQVISTPIRDVVNPYGDEKLVYIASTAEQFAAAIDTALSADLAEHRERAAEFLADISWDKTFAAMSDLVERVVEGGDRPSVASAVAREA